MRRQRGPETARKAAEMRMRRRQRTRGSGRHVPPRAAYRGQADPSVRPRRWRLPKPPWGSVGQLQEALQNTVEEILARDKKLVSDFWRGMTEPPRLQALRVCTSTNAQARARRQRHADRQDHKQANKQANILACFRAATRTYARRSSPWGVRRRKRQMPVAFCPPVRPHATCRPHAAAIVCGVSAGKYDAEAAKYWDLFYRRNEDRFFKVPTSSAASPAVCSRPCPAGLGRRPPPARRHSPPIRSLAAVAGGAERDHVHLPRPLSRWSAQGHRGAARRPRGDTCATRVRRTSCGTCRSGCMLPD